MFGFYRAYTFSNSGPQILGLHNLRERKREIVLVRLKDVGTMLRMDLVIVVIIVSVVPQRVFKSFNKSIIRTHQKMGINICSHAL